MSDGSAFGHPGDPFGTVFAALWRKSEGTAMLALADFMVALQVHDPLSEQVDIGLNTVLKTVPLAFPENFSDAECEAFVERAWSEVPKYFANVR